MRNLGKPVELAERYYMEGADEITFLKYVISIVRRLLCGMLIFLRTPVGECLCCVPKKRSFLPEPYRCG